ncbi:hypothetical protein G7Y89_g10701 [Cudoniella acicularis]|uniref:PHD-type domain-containing protein n=1 Tax=Cudoniella acicularis TaxID=354080 RepID=A0A8H4RC90_9HELO|nr:hypothetical protein G7Y89_g10701 [Cudoniella acicularis]
MDPEALAQALANAGPAGTALETSSSESATLPAPFVSPESLAPAPSPLPMVSNNKPGFKYKYPEAAPTPPGEDDAEWNKVYTAADSRFYNRNGKNSDKSRKFRQSGETYELALVMMKEKKEKAAAAAVGGVSGAPKAPPKPKPAKKPPATVKKESSTSSRDVTPGGDRIPLSISEQIKSEGRPRKAPSAAPSSKQSTPAPTAAPKLSSPVPPPPPPPKIEKPPMKKKGTAAPIKKPSKPKSEGKPNSSTNPTAQPTGPRNISSDSESNDGGEYCICRGPDDHRMMVNCEGGCDEWYHCSCINMDVEDAKELLDRYICMKCSTPTLFTTWKRMCRYHSVGKWYGITPCRKAARVTSDPPSKYCSDEHRDEFFKFVAKELVRQDDAPSIGGKLNGNEVRSILEHCESNAQLQALGKKPKLPIPEGSRPIGLEYITEEEEQELREIESRKHIIEQRMECYKNQQKLLVMVHERAQAAAKHLNVAEKSICGYDNRLAVNEHEFSRWKESPEGISAFTTGKLGPRTPGTKTITARIYAPHQTIPSVPDVANALNNICLNKSCKKHTLWRIVHGQDYAVMQANLKKDLEKLQKQAEEIIEDAETREATKEYHAHNTVEQLF